MPYEATKWVNDKEPFIDAENLNKIEKCLEEVTFREHLNIKPINDIKGYGEIAKFSHTCMFGLEFQSPIVIGGETEIYSFPDGFKPTQKFTVPVFNMATFENIGIATYNPQYNTLVFRTNVQDNFTCHVYCVYVTTDKL